MKMESITKASQGMGMVLSDLNEFLGSASAMEALVVMEIIEAIAKANAKLDRLFFAIGGR